MGLLRNTTLVLLTSILFFSLIFSNLFLTLSWSLEHETLYPELQNITRKTLEEYKIIPDLKKDFEKIEMYCLNQEYFAFNSGEYSLKIPCETIKEGYNKTIEYGIGSFINETYFKEYDCEILECFKEENQPFVLVSEKTQKFFNDKFNLFLIISIITLVLVFLLSKKKHNAFITSGILIILSALPFKEIKWLTSLFEDSIVFEFLGVFFTKSKNVYLIMMVIGIFFLILGITLFLLKYGLKISNWFKKKEKQVEEELKENSEKENIKNNEENKETIEQKTSQENELNSNSEENNKIEEDKKQIKNKKSTTQKKVKKNQAKKKN